MNNISLSSPHFVFYNMIKSIEKVDRKEFEKNLSTWIYQSVRHFSHPQVASALINYAKHRIDHAEASIETEERMKRNQKGEIVYIDEKTSNKPRHISFTEIKVKSGSAYKTVSTFESEKENKINDLANNLKTIQNEIKSILAVVPEQSEERQVIITALKSIHMYVASFQCSNQVFTQAELGHHYRSLKTGLTTVGLMASSIVGGALLFFAPQIGVFSIACMAMIPSVYAFASNRKMMKSFDGLEKYSRAAIRDNIESSEEFLSLINEKEKQGFDLRILFDQDLYEKNNAPGSNLSKHLSNLTEHLFVASQFNQEPQIKIDVPEKTPDVMISLDQIEINKEIEINPETHIARLSSDKLQTFKDQLPQKSEARQKLIKSFKD